MFLYIYSTTRLYKPAHDDILAGVVWEFQIIQTFLSFYRGIGSRAWVVRR